MVLNNAVIFIYTVHGGWGNITNDTSCNRTCGSWIQKLSKICDSPKPENGGSDCMCNEEKYCDGKTATIEITCNLGPCPGNIEMNINLIY